MPYPVPTTCRYCGGKVELTSNAKIYGREYGNGKCYKCTSCDAYVGVHGKKSSEPLGLLANKELRSLKRHAHSLFDPLWRSRSMSRSAAYARLAEKLGIPVHECHFGWFEKPMLLKAIEILESGELWKP